MTAPGRSHGDCALERSVTRHDLITPLHQIIGYGEMLMEDTVSAGQAALASDLGRIVQAAREATMLVDRLFAGASAELAKTSKGEGFAAPSGATGLAGGAAGRVLVVDDSEANRHMLCRRLERQGYLTEQAADGVAGLASLRSRRFDLVLLDVMMPELDGFAVLQQIKADRRLRSIPVIMISAQSEFDSVVRCIELGAEDYLQKPFNPTLLKARVAASLEKQRLREQEQACREESLRAEATLERHRSLAQMVAGVAHEINTPLGIASTAQSVIERCLSSAAVRTLFEARPDMAETYGDIREAGELLRKNVLRAHRLVETFKKVSVSQITETREPVDLPTLVSDSVELFGIGARHAGLTVTIDTSGLHGATEWLGYPGCFTQIMMNLLQNIERYAYPGGIGGAVEIAIADDLQGDIAMFRVMVRDHGQGIAAENLPRLFEPFFTTARGFGGTGLGLAIVANLATSLLQGEITASSEPGQGACFTLVFPKQVGG